MKNKECKITCDGKDVATILCSKDGCSIRPTEEGKKLFSEHCKEGCC
jgi:hypothetical protein